MVEVWFRLENSISYVNTLEKGTLYVSVNEHASKHFPSRMQDLEK